MVVIVISGQPGAGSSTIAKLLAKRLKLRHFSAGKVFKKEGTGKETARAIQFLKTKRGSSAKYHKVFDAMVAREAKKGNMVIDAKLGVRMLKKYYDFSVWLKAPKRARAKRFVKRDRISLQQAVKEVGQRDSLERSMWKHVYGFDYFAQEKQANIVINTAGKTQNQIVDIIVSRIKRVFIVHRWEGRPHKDWYSYVKHEMKKKGYIADVLNMPSPDTPAMKKWVSHLSQAIGETDENTFLVGHSAGAMTILRYLENLPDNKKVGGCVFVAGWIDNLGYKELNSFFTKPIKWNKIRRHCKRFVAIHSDNDPYVKMYHGKAFKKYLKAKLIVLHNRGHMTDEEGIRKLPQVVSEIAKF